MHNLLPNVKHLSPWILPTRKPEVSAQLFGFKDFPGDLDGTYGQQDTRIDNTWHWQHISSLLIGTISLLTICHPDVTHMFFPEYRVLLFFFKIFGGHKSFLWGHWYHCLRLLVTSPLGFKARVAASFLAWQRHTGYMFLETYGLHVPWDSPENTMFNQIQTGRVLYYPAPGWNLENLIINSSVLPKSCAT